MCSPTLLSPLLVGCTIRTAWFPMVETSPAVLREPWKACAMLVEGVGGLLCAGLKRRANQDRVNASQDPEAKRGEETA